MLVLVKIPVLVSRFIGREAASFIVHRMTFVDKQVMAVIVIDVLYRFGMTIVYLFLRYNGNYKLKKSYTCTQPMLIHNT